MARSLLFTTFLALIVLNSKVHLAVGQAPTAPAAPLDTFPTARDLAPLPEPMIQVGIGDTATIRLGQGIYLSGGTIPHLSPATLIADTAPAKQDVWIYSCRFINGESVTKSQESSQLNLEIRHWVGVAGLDTMNEHAKERLDRSLLMVIDLVSSIESIQQPTIDEATFKQLSKLSDSKKIKTLVALYGLGYVAELHQGSQVLIHAEMSEKNERAKSALLAQLNASLLGFGAKGSAETTSEFSEALRSTKCNIYIVAGKYEGDVTPASASIEETVEWLNQLKTRKVVLGDHPLKAKVRSYYPLLLLSDPMGAANIRAATESLQDTSVRVQLEPPIVSFTPPHISNNGDTDYWTGPGNPTKCEGSVTLSVVDASSIFLKIFANIEESGGDHTTAREERSWRVFTAPKGWQIQGFQISEGGPLHQERSLTLEPQFSTQEYEQLFFADRSPEPLTKVAKIWGTKRYGSAGLFGRIEVELRPITIVLAPQ